MEEIIKIVSEHNLKMSGNKKNVLTSLIWIICALSPVLMLSFNTESIVLQIIISTAFSLMILIFCAAFIYFMLKDPERLQSEKYQLEKRRLDIAAQKNEKQLGESQNVEVLDKE